MMGARSPIYSAAVTKARCRTKSCWFLEALYRASQTGGRTLASVTCTRFSRCAKLAPKYSVAPLLSFFHGRACSPTASLLDQPPPPQMSL